MLGCCDDGDELDQDPIPPPINEPVGTGYGYMSNDSKSGRHWCNKYPGSRSINDLEGNFASQVGSFINALKNAQARLTISSTYRPPERAYLMHWSWRIVNSNIDILSIPGHSGVGIQWWHGDRESSVRGAQEMVDGFSIRGLGTAPALNSRHTTGHAIDMTIGWSGTLMIQDASGQKYEISSIPRDGTNDELIEVGASFGAIHFLNKMRDRPHWSIDGR
jgi:hypothetical protein